MPQAVPAPYVSVVLPVYNEVDNLELLLTEIAQAIGPLGAFEVVCVDDASKDGSYARLQELRATRPWLRLFRHRRNCGQSAALAIGFQAARGEIVCTLDADGQNDPADLPALIAALEGEVVLCCGVRAKRQDTFVKRASSKIANRIRQWLTGDYVTTDAGCALRAVRRRALREVPVFNGMHRWLPTMLQAQGYVIAQRPTHHRPRLHGVSKYGIGNRAWRGLRDCFAMRWYRARVLPAERADEDLG